MARPNFSARHPALCCRFLSPCQPLLPHFQLYLQNRSPSSPLTTKKKKRTPLRRRFPLRSRRCTTCTELSRPPLSPALVQVCLRRPAPPTTISAAPLLALCRHHGRDTSCAPSGAAIAASSSPRARSPIAPDSAAEPQHLLFDTAGRPGGLRVPHRERGASDASHEVSTAHSPQHRRSSEISANACADIVPLIASAYISLLCFRVFLTAHSPTRPSPALTSKLSLIRTFQINTAKMGHEDAVYLAKLAEQAERYEGMLKSIHMG